MRHTCVSLLLHLGVAPDMVREIVGHSDIEVTMTIYAHTSLDEKRRALGKLGEAWPSQKLAVAVTVAVKRPGRRDPPGRFACSHEVVRGGVEPPTFRFSGASAGSPDGVRRCCTSQPPAVIAAGIGLLGPGACRHWPPVWLPGISLA